MIRSFTRKALAAVALTASATGLIASTASAADATLSPTSGNQATSFGLALPASAACSGAGSASFTYTSYFLPASANLATYNFVGGVPNPPSGQFGAQLSDAGGTPVGPLSPTPSFQMIDLPSAYSHSTIPALPNYNLLTPGAYKIGIACVTPAGALDGANFWEAPITVSTVTPTGFNWAFGAVASGPTITASAGDASISGVLTPVTATPAVTGYVVSATPVGGGSAVTVNVPAAGPYTYTISGLTNGTAYNVTAVAVNAVGNSAPASPLNNPYTPSLAIVTPAPVVSVASGPSPVTVSWLPSTGSPSGGATLVNHTVTFTPVGSAAPIAPVTVPAGTNTINVTGAASDGYTIRVVGNYSNGQVTADGAGAFSFTNAQVVVQDITVVRPQGALVLTQRCGVHGSAPSYTNSAFGPTFPAMPASAGADPVGTEPPAAVGTAPIADSNATVNDPNSFGTGPVGPVGNTTAAGSPDGLFGQYPYPVDASGNAIATYATNCAINLNTASLITSGPNAGAYFRATGRIAQLTVVDTRDTDAGWTLNGRMGQFSNATATAAATDSFSGNFMGWVPEVTWDSNPNLDGYNTTATAGGARLPQGTASTTGLGAQNPSNVDLANSLAKANAGAGLGMAVMDARLNLLIPVTADAGIYKGVLTFTIV